MLKLFKSTVIIISFCISLLTPHIVFAEDINIQTTINDDSFTVNYYFVDSKTLSSDDLPEEVLKLIPDKEYVSSVDEVSLLNFDESVDSYVFDRWEGGINIDDKQITYIGLWKKLSFRSIPHPGYSPDAAAGSQYSVAMDGTVSGATMHQTLNGSEAICIEPEVRTYALPNTGFWRTGSISSRTAEIIWLGRRNGASWGAIQAAVWNQMYGYIKYTYGSENVDPDSSTFNSNGSYNCSGPYYETQDYGGTLTMQSLTNMDEVGCTIKVTKGDIKVVKSAKQSSIDYMKLYPNDYSLANAKYGLFSDEACTKQVATFTTDSNGISNTVNVNSGVYYVKEIEPSKGFLLDKNIYKATINANSLTTIQSIEEIKEGTLKFLKQTNHTSLLNTYPDYYSLENAEYGLFLDKNCTKKILSISSKANGKADDIKLPEATYYLKETKAPKGFKLDPNVYPINITNKQITDISLNDDAYYGSIRINKKSKETDYDLLKLFPNNYSLENAEYGVYKDEACSSLLTTIKTNNDGSSKVVNIPIGNYYIKEIKASKGFKLDNNVYQISIEDQQLETIESIEEPIFDPTLITLYKQNIQNKQDTKYLDEVEFVLKYYDSQEKTINEDDLKYTWVFKALINDNNEAEIIFDKKHYVGGDELLLDENDNLKLSLGSFSIEESVSPQTYARDENIYVGHVVNDNENSKVIFEDGEWMSKDEVVQLFSTNSDSNRLKLRQLERKVILKTSAIFEESGTDHYVADGIAHIKDTVEYDYLEEDHEYILKAKLINKKDESVLKQEEITFKADDSKKTSISFKVNLDNYDSYDFVVYEYIYDKSDPEKLIAKHEDINDEQQTVHVDRLYRADMILYKIGGTRGVKLNGAIFNIKTNRIKADGTKVEKDLGKYISGGIFIEQEKPFVFKLGMDKNLQIVIDTIDSKTHPKFNSQYVSIHGLDEGIYYGQINNNEIVKYEIKKGMIKLDKVEKDTEITYTELVAPAGYYLDEDAYVVNVGDDDTLTQIENYRMNRAIIIPKTGI